MLWSSRIPGNTSQKTECHLLKGLESAAVEKKVCQCLGTSNLSVCVVHRLSQEQRGAELVQIEI